MNNMKAATGLVGMRNSNPVAPLVATHRTCANCVTKNPPCFSQTRLPQRYSKRRHGCRASPNKQGPTDDTGAGLKAVWYAAEMFGKAIGGGKTAQEAPRTTTARVMSREEILESIKADYSENYFVSGLGDMAAYADDCVFADPFVSFQGTRRFKQNVGNLGGLMKDIKLDIYEFNEPSPDQVTTKWRFSCVLDLPWKPLLAAAGGTTHVIDLEKGQVVKHIEMWDVEPSKVVGQLFKPASKIPSNAWETFFASASSGDVAGMWLVSCPQVIKITAPVVAVSVTCKLITGEGLPGVALGAIEGVSWLLLVSAGITQLVEMVKGAVGGGESG